MWLRWDLKHAFVAAVFAAATFAIAFVLGNSITLALGPGTSGFVSAVITTILVVVGANIVRRLGTFTLMVTLFTVLAIPTNLFGPPGPYKIAIGACTGIVYDLVWFTLSKLKLEKLALPAAAAVATGVSLLLVFWLLSYLGHPKTDDLRKILVFAVPIYALLGLLGGWLGNVIYGRIKHLSVVRQLEG